MAKKGELVSLANQIPLFASKEVPDAFRKAVEILHNIPKAPLTLLQRKLFNALVKHAIESQPDERGWWAISLMALQEDVGFDSNNREYIKESARTLMNIVFEWDVMAPQTKKGTWKASVMFPDVELHPDQLKFQVSSHLRDLISKPEVYALIDMSIMRRFRRASSLAIWEFCVRYEKLERTAEQKWESFRDMVLGETADAPTYQEYKYFKSKVLNPSIAEINAEANITIKLHETKIGRRVSTIRFDVHRKPVDDDVIEDNSPDLEVLGDMIRLGVLQSEAKKLLKSYGSQKVRDAIAYTRRRQADKRAQKLDNVAAYFRHALQSGYAATEEKRAALAPSPAKQPKVDLRERYLQQQMKLAEGYFGELDAPDQSLLIERYNDSQATSSLKLGKKVSKASEMAFRRWLALDVWGEPTSEQLLEFAQSMLSGST